MNENLIERAHLYCRLIDVEVIENPALGHGTDGSVWKTSRQTAIKVFYYEKNYFDELECYQRLKDNDLTEIEGLAVPELEGYNHQIMVVEISIVQKPCLLDFGKVYIDEPPPYIRDSLRMARWHEDIRENFEKNASHVYRVLSRLKAIGINYTDPRPSNIMFLDDPED